MRDGAQQPEHCRVCGRSQLCVTGREEGVGDGLRGHRPILRRESRESVDGKWMKKSMSVGN